MHKLFPHPRTQGKQQTPSVRDSVQFIKSLVLRLKQPTLHSSLLLSKQSSTSSLIIHPISSYLIHSISQLNHHTPLRTCIGLVYRVSTPFFPPFISSPSFPCFSFYIEQGILLGNHLIVCHFEPPFHVYNLCSFGGKRRRRG